MVDDEPIVFRPKRREVFYTYLFGTICLILGILLTLGLAIVVGMDEGIVEVFLALSCCSAMTLLLGFLSFILGLRASMARVTLDRKGIWHSPVMFGGFAFKWKAVDGWWIGSTEHPSIHFRDLEEWEQKVLRFDVCGRIFHVTVYESDVAQPGFDAFVAAVHRFVPDREWTLPSHPYYQGGNR